MIAIVASSRYKIDRKKVKSSVAEWMNKLNIYQADFNVILVGKNKMRSLTDKYKKDDVLHPVLSFDLRNHGEIQRENVTGEVFICYPQAILLASERNKRVDDTIIELIEHGISSIMS